MRAPHALGFSCSSKARLLTHDQASAQVAVVAIGVEDGLAEAVAGAGGGLPSLPLLPLASVSVKRGTSKTLTTAKRLVPHIWKRIHAQYPILVLEEAKCGRP